jgi:hypothetical protein
MDGVVYYNAFCMRDLGNGMGEVCYGWNGRLQFISLHGIMSNALSLSALYPHLTSPEIMIATNGIDRMRYDIGGMADYNSCHSLMIRPASAKFSSAVNVSDQNGDYPEC